MKTLKQLALLPLFLGLVLTTACTENYDNGNGTDNGYYNGGDNGNGDTPFNRTITAVVENGNNYNDLISTVAMRFWANDSLHTIATGTWANGGFTITLPETIDADEYFIAFLRREEGIISISDTSARVGGGLDLELNAYDEQQRRIGTIWYGDADWHYYGVMLFYADRDVTIIGTITHQQRHTYNLQLRAGWNRVYITVIDFHYEWCYNMQFYIPYYHISTEPISGLRWHFRYWD